MVHAKGGYSFVRSRLAEHCQTQRLACVFGLNQSESCENHTKRNQQEITIVRCRLWCMNNTVRVIAWKKRRTHGVHTRGGHASRTPGVFGCRTKRRSARGAFGSRRGWSTITSNNLAADISPSLTDENLSAFGSACSMLLGGRCISASLHPLKGVCRCSSTGLGSS